MSDPNDPGNRQPPEGVRIIGPEEAQAALEAGAAGGRRSDDELGFGDVPPVPSGPRSPHRFPLPDSVDPAEAVRRPPVIPPRAEPPAARSSWLPSDEAPGSFDEGVTLRRADSDAHADTREHPVVDPGAPPLPDAPAAGAETTVEHSAAAAPLAGDDAGGPQPAPAPEPLGHDDEAAVGSEEPAWLRRARAPWPSPRPAPTEAAPVAESQPWELPTGPLPAAASGAAPADRPAPAPPEEARPDIWASLVAADEPALPVPPAPVAGAQPASPTPAAPTPGTPTPGTPTPGSPPPGAAAEAPPADLAARPGAPTISAPLADPTVPLTRPVDDEAVAGLPRRLGGRGAPTRNPNRRASRGNRRPAAVPPADEAPEPLEEGAAVSSGFGADLPHWTDPPTGEVPRILAGRAGTDDDLAAWEALGSRSSTWRDDSTGWGHVDEGLDDLIDDEAPVGALDSTRAEHSDLYSFDEDFERLEEERSGQYRVVEGAYEADPDVDEEWAEPQPLRVGSRPQPMRSGGARARSRRRPPGDGAGGGDGGRGPSSEVGSRVVVGAALVAALAIATAVGPALLLLLALVIITAAAVEAFDLVRPAGFKPATLLGLAGTVGVVLAAYWRGVDALPLVTVLVFVGSMCWYLFKVVDAPPLVNAAVSTATFVWVGLLGSYAALLLRLHSGRGLFLGAVIPVVVADIVAFFAGRSLGSRPLAPSISPSKTWEGAIGGGVGAVLSGVIVGATLSPWGGARHGLVLGLAVAVLAPIGDLFESMVKRDLAVKDSSKVLSAHGGVLDRFDSLLVVLPAAYYLASWWHLAA